MNFLFPHYTQFYSSDCGPACLRIISKYYGFEYSSEMLRNHCFISRNGVSMLGISDAAEYIGFRTRAVKITFKQLVEQARLPCILHWNQNHFVVCYDIKRGITGKYHIYISDPATECLCYSKEEFLQHWISTVSDGKSVGMALLLEPTPNLGKREEEMDFDKKNYSSFLKYFFSYKWFFAQIILAMIFGSLIQLVIPFLTQAMVDNGINCRDMNFITLILIAQLILFFSSLSVGFIRSWIMLHINTRIDISLISDFLLKLMSLPLRFFDSKNTGDLIQRIGDYGRVKNFLMGNSISILFSLINFFVFGFVLGCYSFTILWIFLLGNLLNVLWVSLFLRYRRELDYKRFNQTSAQQNNIIQLIQGMQDIKLNNCEKQKRWEWEAIQVNLFNISVRGLKIGQIQEVGSIFFTKTTDIIITFIAASSVVSGNMTLGMMMSLTYILGQLTAPIYDFINLIHSLQDASISLERLNEIHAMKSEDHNGTKQTSILPEIHDIVLRNLYFSYSGAERDTVLKDISITIPYKKVTAIVGESGSGKTTLLKLIQGFYEITNGTLTVGGIPLSSINPHFWRENSGTVMQDSFIFSDSIANNIAMTTDDIDIQRLYNSAKIANIDGFISNLPLGYNTKIGREGMGLSQGQKQRILIARAVYKNPQFIIFDEATNALDATNESVIMNNLHDFYKGRTVIIAAHRLSTVKDADNIIVLKQGKVIEQGTHSQLIEQKGEYYTLVKNQLNL